MEETYVTSNTRTCAEKTSFSDKDDYIIVEWGKVIMGEVSLQKRFPCSYGMFSFALFVVPDNFGWCSADVNFSTYFDWFEHFRTDSGHFRTDFVHFHIDSCWFCTFLDIFWLIMTVFYRFCQKDLDQLIQCPVGWAWFAGLGLPLL